METPLLLTDKTVPSPGWRFWRPAMLVAGVLLLLVLALWWDSRERIGQLQAETARHLTDSDARLQKEVAAASVDHAALLNAQNRLAELERQLVETQSQSVALAAMYQDVVRSGDDRLLAEIEQSLSIAAQQLELAGNVEAALIALQAADERLGSTTQTRFVPLRRLLARDIARLQSLPAANLTGLALKLESLVSVLDSLPLAYEHRPEPKLAKTAVAKTTAPKKGEESTAAAPGIAYGVLETLGSDFWQELKQLIRIERVDQGDPALLAPSQTVFLRENLRLRLLSARLALLQRDSANYHQDLRQVKAQLERYFDVQAKPVQAALATIARLDDTNLALRLPTLNESIAALRKIKQSRAKAN